MATTIALDCPLDRLPLVAAKVALVRGDGGRDATSHFHVAFDEQELTCPNGHAWFLVGTLKLTRAERQRAR